MQQNELLTKIKLGTAPIIVDVRSQFEYKAGHISRAIHIPFWIALITDQLDGYEKNTQLVLYCEHGPRAVIAKLALSWRDFKNINYLAGHMAAWKKAGLPVEA